MPKCNQCEAEIGKGFICSECYEENKAAMNKIEAARQEGHTLHCAMRLIWGDGECECEKEVNYV